MMSGSVERLVGFSVSGREARCAAADSVGKNSAPRCPQALKTTAVTPRAIVLNRIWQDFNIYLDCND